MTREEIEQMPAGRELDRLIAEKVLGLSVYHYDKDHADNCYFMLMDTEGDPVLFTGRHRDAERKTEAAAWGDCPAYSTDIAAAWEVLMEMKDRRRRYATSRHGFAMSEALIERPEGEWVTVFKCQIGGRENRGYEDTAPLAICKAALLASLTA